MLIDCTRTWIQVGEDAGVEEDKETLLNKSVKAPNQERTQDSNKQNRQIH